jgi:hypothetical protein
MMSKSIVLKWRREEKTMILYLNYDSDCPGAVKLPDDELTFESTVSTPEKQERPGNELKILESKSFTNRASFSLKEFLTQSIAKKIFAILCAISA